MQKICKCPQCETPMEFKGEFEGLSQGSAVFYQCPKCKNVQLYARRSSSEFRLEYP